MVVTGSESPIVVVLRSDTNIYLFNSILFLFNICLIKLSYSENCNYQCLVVFFAFKYYISLHNV